MGVFKCSLVVCLLLGTVYSQMSILNVTTVVDGQPFLITCDARRVIIPTEDARTTSLLGLYISIQTGTAQSYTLVAQYLAFGPDSELTVSKPPEGRDWVPNFTGSNGNNTRDTMKIEVLVRKAVCLDAGLYKCTVDYFKPSGGSARLEKEQNVTSQAAVTEPVLTLDPIFDAPLGWSNYSALDLNQTVTLTCRIEGPEGLSLTWRRERRPAVGMDTTFDKYPIANDIVDASPAPVTTSTCSQHRYTSALTLRASEDDTERKYQCVVQSGDQDVAFAVAVIDLKKDTSTKPSAGGVGDAAAAGSKPDTALIVGVVVGCVAALIIVAIIIGVICYRRSKKNSYKDSTDRPDGAPGEQPPPNITYSQPVKGNNNRVTKNYPGKTNDALDASFESRGSANKAPPVYTINGGNDRPNQTEVNRGRQNKGYNEEDRDANFDNRQRPTYYNTDGRLQGRRYSTEDNDDRRYAYEDADFGTGV